MSRFRYRSKFFLSATKPQGFIKVKKKKLAKTGLSDGLAPSYYSEVQLGEQTKVK